MESYISTGMSLHWKRNPRCFTVICTTVPLAILYGLAYYAVLSVPGVSDICYYHLVPQGIKANVEERFCTLVFDLKVTTLIAL